MRFLACAGAVCVLLLLSRTASAQLIIPDSTGDRIMLFDAFDGSLIDADWIVDSGAVGWEFSTPREAMVIGGQVWVSDQIEDAVHRFDLITRDYVSSITAHPLGGTLDNLRGLGFDGTNVYVTNGPTGSANAARRGGAIYDTSGNAIDFFQIIGSPFDIEPFEGGVLVSNSDTDNIEFYNASGVFQNNFATGVDFPQQVKVLADGSVLAVSTIAAPGVEGIYHFNANGSLRHYISTEPIEEMVPQGIELLGDGAYLLSTSAGIYKVIDSGGGNFSFTLVLGGVGGQYINAIPEPSAAGLLLGAAALLRRRRSARTR